MSMLIIGALLLWLVAGVVLGFLIGPRMRALPPRSDIDYRDLM